MPVDPLEEALNLLRWLNRKGGLGLDVHERIDTILAELDRREEGRRPPLVEDCGLSDDQLRQLERVSESCAIAGLDPNMAAGREVGDNIFKLVVVARQVRRALASGSRSPPTREGPPVYVGPYSPGSNEWWFVRRVATSDVRRAWYELTDADREALAAAPPPPDVSRGLGREALRPILDGLVGPHTAAEWRDIDNAIDAIIALSAPAGGGMDSQTKDDTR